jgi:hypothetical protein
MEAKIKSKSKQLHGRDTSLNKSNKYRKVNQKCICNAVYLNFGM